MFCLLSSEYSFLQSILAHLLFNVSVAYKATHRANLFHSIAADLGQICVKNAMQGDVNFVGTYVKATMPDLPGAIVNFATWQADRKSLIRVRSRNMGQQSTQALSNSLMFCTYDMGGGIDLATFESCRENLKYLINP